MSDFSEEKKILPFGLKDTKAGSQLNSHKLTAFEIAPARKTAFERSREEARRKAEREAAETAAALQDFEAEYGVEEDTKSRSTSYRNNTWRPLRDSSHGDRDGRKRNRYPSEEKRTSGSDDEGIDSETEERERRRIKLKSGSHFLDELKQTNRRSGRPIHQDRHQQERKSTPSLHADSNVRPSMARQESATSFQETKKTTDEAEDESGDDVEYYRTKASTMTTDEPLNKIHQAKLKFLLDTTTARRGSVARVTAFAMTHASSIEEISTRLCDSVAETGIDWKTSVARLWCISDILHNSWIPIPNVWKYRNAFEEKLEVVLSSMRQLGNLVQSRIRHDNYRRLVEGVLQVWSTWICFSNGFVDKLYKAFDDTPEVEEIVLEVPKEEKKSRGWRTIGDPVNEKPEATKGDICISGSVPDPGDDVEVDGEAIDLDGEAIDLDGVAIDLDETIVNVDGMPQVEPPIQASIVTTIMSDPVQTLVEPPSQPTTITSTIPNSGPSAPKIKMSFGKFSIPKKGTAASKPDQESRTMSNDLDEYEKLAKESLSSQAEPISSINRVQESSQTDASLASSTAQSQTATAPPPRPSQDIETRRDLSIGNNSRKPPERHGRPQRRSAADFMD